MTKTNTGLLAGDSIEVEIKSLGYGGVGVGRHDSGIVCLVAKSLPGDRIQGTVIKKKKRHIELTLEKILQPSTDRVNPPCEYFDTCGGCHLQQLEYAKQVEAKQKLLLENLERASTKTKLQDITQPLVPAPNHLEYRNKIVFHYHRGTLGFVNREQEELLDINKCLLVSDTMNDLIHGLRTWLQGAGKPVTPFLQDCVLRRSQTTNEGSLVLILDENAASQKTAQQLIKSGPFAELMGMLGMQNALWLNFKNQRVRHTFGDHFVHIGGPAIVHEDVGPFRLALSPSSFAQVNPPQAAALYEKAVELLQPQTQESLLDLYSGSGSLALFMAKHVKDIHGIELDQYAVEDAKRNVMLNNMQNTTFHNGRCEKVIRKLRENSQRFQIATMNPPRGGVHENVIKTVKHLGVTRIAYVSCSMSTLIRDIKLFEEQQYTAKHIVPFDMFAQTHHLELLTLLEKD